MDEFTQTARMKDLQIPWKYSPLVILGLCYLCIFVWYLTFPSRSEYSVEDHYFYTTLKRPTTKRPRNIHKNKFGHQNGISTDQNLNHSLTNGVHSQLENGVKSNVKIVIIAAYTRTGSTFIGGIFRHIPRTFYLFEPIRHVFQIPPYGELTYISGVKRTVPPKIDRNDLVMKDIHKWLSCDFHEIDIDTLTDYHHLAFKDSMYGFYNCAISHVEMIKKFQHANNTSVTRRDLLITKNLAAINECLLETRQKCLEAPLRVIKFVRLRMPLVAELLPLYPNMKVIFLQRDPRGSLSSRVKTKLIKVSEFKKSVENYCRSSLNDIRFLRNLTVQFPDRLKTLIYEDVAENPVAVLKKVFEFCHLDFTDQMQQYTISLTSLGGKNSCSFCIEKGNSTETAYAWRKDMSITRVMLTDVKCFPVYDILGYRRFFKLRDLRNFSLSSRTSPKPFLRLI